MRILKSVLHCVFVLLVFCGCRAQYLASAKVLVKTNGARPSQAVMDSEVHTVRSIAAEFVSADEQFRVRHNANTSLIGVTVTTPNPETSVLQCNRIIQKYVGMTNDAVVRQVLEKAVAPKQRIR